MRRFARDGFSNTSMADIIQEAGSSSGSVYSHFAGKAELMRYAASFALRDLVTAITTELPAERTPASVLAHLLRASIDRAHARTLLQIWSETHRDPELAIVARDSTLDLRALLAATLLPWCRSQSPERQHADQAAEALADALLTTLQGFIVRLSIDDTVDVDALIERSTQVFHSA
jgi:AcrR family transcriptional regulator